MSSFQRFINARDPWAWLGLNQWTGLLIHDDSGRVVPLRDTARHPPLVGRREREAAEREKAWGRWRHRLQPFGLALLLLVVVEVVWTSRQGKGIAYSLASIFGVAYMVAIVFRRFRLLWLNRRARRRSRRREFEYEPIIKSLGEDACPCCGYGLAGVPEDEQGVAKCPECAAAWKPGLWRRDWPVIAAPTWRDDRNARSRWAVDDARGRSVRLLADMDSPDARERRSAARRWFWFGDLLVVAAYLAVTAGLVLFYVWMRNGRLDQSIMFAFLGSQLYVLAFMFPLVIWRRRAGRGRWTRAIIARRLGDSLCPSCGDGLDMTPSEIDGTAVCHGCGSAWRNPTKCATGNSLPVHPCSADSTG